MDNFHVRAASRPGITGNMDSILSLLWFLRKTTNIEASEQQTNASNRRMNLAGTGIFGAFGDDGDMINTVTLARTAYPA